MVQREAVFLISRAAEEFVARIAEASQAVAAREGRATVQAKDLSACISCSCAFATPKPTNGPPPSIMHPTRRRICLS